MRSGSFVLCAALASAPCFAHAQSSAPPAPSGVPDRPWTAPPLAEPPSRADIDQARQRFQRGVQLADSGDFNGARAEFVQAYVLTHNPRVLFNISASDEALGNVVDALDALRAFETQAPADVVRRQQAQLTAAETRLQNRIGTLIVESSAPSVEIRLDGVQRPTADLHAGLRLPAGHHHLALSAPGYSPREEDVDVPGNAALHEVVTLTRLHASVTVESNVAGADVVIDDTSAGTTPLSSAVDVTQGTHRVRVHRAGYVPYETQVNVGSEGAHVNASLAWAENISPDVAARLSVQMPDPGGRATLDGRGISLEGTEPLPPGTHRLRVEHNDRLPIEHPITLAPAHQSVVDVVLMPTLAARQARVRSVQSYGWIFGIAGVGIFLAGGIWFAVNEVNAAHAQADLDSLNMQYFPNGVPLPTTSPIVFGMITNDQGALAAASGFRAASSIIAGVGLGGIAAGAVILLVAPRLDTGPHEATFRIRAGLGSIGAEWRF